MRGPLVDILWDSPRLRSHGIPPRDLGDNNFFFSPLKVFCSNYSYIYNNACTIVYRINIRSYRSRVDNLIIHPWIVYTNLK